MKRPEIPQGVNQGPQLPGTNTDQPTMSTMPPTNPPGSQVTTKPRQIPGGGPGQQMPGAGQFDPNMMGGPQQQQSGGAALPGTPETGPNVNTDANTSSAPDTRNAKVSMVAYDVLTTNPSLPPRMALYVAQQVVDGYLSKEADWPSNPLGFTSWENPSEGPLMRKFQPGEWITRRKQKGEEERQQTGYENYLREQHPRHYDRYMLNKQDQEAGQERIKQMTPDPNPLKDPEGWAKNKIKQKFRRGEPAGPRGPQRPEPRTSDQPAQHGEDAHPGDEGEEFYHHQEEPHDLTEFDRPTQPDAPAQPQHRGPNKWDVAKGAWDAYKIWRRLPKP